MDGRKTAEAHYLCEGENGERGSINLPLLMKKIILAFCCLVAIKTFAQDTSAFSFHFQSTSISQHHTKFKSPYEGYNSLQRSEKTASSLTNTLFLAAKPWKNGLFILNP